MCDTVMDKVGYPRGLVKYSTENAVNQHWTRGQTLRHVLRPRVLIYTSILGAVVVAMAVSLAMRIPFKVDVVRDRGALARIADGGRIENVFRMQIMNATEATQQFHISVTGMPELEVVSENDIEIASTQARWVAVRVLGPMDGAAPGSHTIHFEIAAKSGIGKLTEKAAFIIPR